MAYQQIEGTKLEQDPDTGHVRLIARPNRKRKLKGFAIANATALMGILGLAGWEVSKRAEKPVDQPEAVATPKTDSNALEAKPGAPESYEPYSLAEAYPKLDKDIKALPDLRKGSVVGSDPEAQEVIDNLISVNEANPYYDPNAGASYPGMSGMVIEGGEPKKPRTAFLRSNSYREASLKLGSLNGISYVGVANKTATFNGLCKQACISGANALIDIHVNAGKGSGPITVSNEAGKPLGDAVEREFAKIYKEEGWVNDRVNPSQISSKFTLLNAAKKCGLRCVITEFGFHDDKNNGKKAVDFLLTKRGQERVARAMMAAIESQKLDTVALSMGHHGARGFYGLNFKDSKGTKYHEIDYAERQIDTVARIISENVVPIAAAKAVDPSPEFGEVVELTELIPPPEIKSEPKLAPKKATSRRSAPACKT